MCCDAAGAVAPVKDFHVDSLMMRSWFVPCLVLTVGFSLQTARAADEPTGESLSQEAVKAWNDGKPELAMELATKAIEKEPKEARWWHLRARIHTAKQEYMKTIEDLNEVLKLQPEAAEIYDERGSAHFMAGNVKESIADFDRYIALRPEKEVSHWKRGISYYYSGQYEEGQKQFEGYQTFDDNDVENAVWRYLCMARSVGTTKARESMLKIKTDTRVPMMQVYDLFIGRIKPVDVLAAARADEPSPEELNSNLFYAHLYLGLYYETDNDREKAFEHLTIAEQHHIGHYMWDVAHVHAERMRKDRKK